MKKKNANGNATINTRLEEEFFKQFDFNGRKSMAEDHRMSKGCVWLALLFVTFVFVTVMGTGWNWLSGKTEFTWAFTFLVSVATFVYVFVPVWIFVNVTMWLIARASPEYKNYKANGGDFYLDNFRGFRDEDFVRGPAELTDGDAIQEQLAALTPNWRPPDWQPPSHWQYQCPKCGAKVEHAIDICWNCNYGAHGDSTTGGTG